MVVSTGKQDKEDRKSTRTDGVANLLVIGFIGREYFVIFFLFAAKRADTGTIYVQ